MRHFPIPLGQVGGGEFILHIDWSKWGMAGVLYQRQHDPNNPVFIGAVGRKCTSYEKEYHSSKGELAALNFALEKYKHFLLQGPFLVRTDNTTVLHWETMKDPGGTIRRWLTNFSYFQFAIEHRAGVQLVDADHLSRQLNLPSPTPSEVEQTRDYEPRFPLPSPLDRFQELIDVEIGGLTQPVGGSCNNAECEPMERCEACAKAMLKQGRVESLLVCAISRAGTQPYTTADTVEPPATWQLILAAQQKDAVTNYFSRQLRGEDQSAVNLDECDDEFKVMAHQFKHLSIAEETESEVPPGILFFKESRIVAPQSIRQKIMSDAHGTGHIGVTKTYTNVKSVWWWPGLFSDVKKMVDLCQTCMLSRKTNLRELEYHPLETVHRPRTLAYMDVLGPVTGIKSEHCYILQSSVKPWVELRQVQSTTSRFPRHRHQVFPTMQDDPPLWRMNGRIGQNK